MCQLCKKYGTGKLVGLDLARLLEDAANAMDDPKENMDHLVEVVDRAMGYPPDKVVHKEELSGVSGWDDYKNAFDDNQED